MASEKWEDGANREAKLPTSASELGSRFEAAIALFRTKKEAADTLDISTDQLTRYIKGQASPPLVLLARLTAAKGVRLDWLATGRGPMLAAEQPPPPASTNSPAPLDADLVGRVLEAISVVYKEAGWGKTLAQLGAEAAQIAADIAADGLSDEARRAAVQAAAAMLRRQLRQAVSQPGGEVAGKRGA